MSRVKVSVTQEDIDRGKRMSMGSCPVARAMERHGFRLPAVLGRIVVVNDRDHRPVSIRVAYSVWRFIRRFDKGRPVQPFNFFAERVA